MPLIRFFIICIEICAVEEVRRKYSCIMPSYFTTDDTGMRCGHNLTTYSDYSPYIKDLPDEFYESCKEQCTGDCESTSFRVQSLRATECDDTRLRFSMSVFSTLQIKQTPKWGFFELISNIVGLLGLFIGASFLSFAAIFVFLIDAVLVICFSY